MSDVVVTVPAQRWDDWIAEGDLPGQPWSGLESHFWIGRTVPRIAKGERVYIVARGQLRGFAPLTYIDRTELGFALVRHGGAEAVTLATPITGFRGWRYRWWDRTEEIPYDFAAEIRQAALL